MSWRLESIKLSSDLARIHISIKSFHSMTFRKLIRFHQNTYTKFQNINFWEAKSLLNLCQSPTYLTPFTYKWQNISCLCRCFFEIKSIAQHSHKPPVPLIFLSTFQYRLVTVIRYWLCKWQNHFNPIT